MSKGRPWTTADDALLSEMVAQGQRRASIARVLGRSLGAIDERMRHRHLGLTPGRRPGTNARRWTEEEDQRLRELLAAETQPAKIAEILHRTGMSVQSRMTSLGIRRQRQRATLPQAPQSPPSAAPPAPPVAAGAPAPPPQGGREIREIADMPADPDKPPVPNPRGCRYIAVENWHLGDPDPWCGKPIRNAAFMYCDEHTQLCYDFEARKRGRQKMIENGVGPKQDLRVVDRHGMRSPNPHRYRKWAGGRSRSD